LCLSVSTHSRGATHLTVKSDLACRADLRSEQAPLHEVNIGQLLNDR